MKKKIGTFTFAILIIFNYFSWNTVASMERKSRVLFISSYNSSFPTFYQQIDEIKSILKVVSHVQQGEIAAGMVQKILSGTKVEQIPIVEKSPNRYIFDYEQLKKYNIDKQLLPKDSLFVNKKVVFYEKFKEYI